MAYFPYRKEALIALKAKDPCFAQVIDRIGIIKREVIPDFFTALVNSIVGQQISARAMETIWRRLTETVGVITPTAILACSTEQLRQCGLSGRKASYIQGAAQAVIEGVLQPDQLRSLPDEALCEVLTGLNGVGRWTAEMLMIFSFQRPDVLSYGDFGIRRGLRMIYQHNKITPELFQQYQKRFSPYGSIASLYLWAVAGGALPELSDPASGSAKPNPVKRKKTSTKGTVPGQGTCIYTFHSDIGPLTVTTDNDAVRSLCIGSGTAQSTGTPSALALRTEQELTEYFQGKRKEFDLPLKPDGTVFQQKVWAALRQIPYGETRSYRQLAEAVGNSKACRAVGMANHRNPILILTPCHRVIGADGSLTGFGAGLDVKRFLLDLENKQTNNL